MAKRIRGSAFALVVLSAVACGGSDDEADTPAGTAGSSNGAGGSSAGASGSAGKAGSATGGAAGKGGSSIGGAGGSTAGTAGSTTTGGGAGSAGKGDTAAPTFAGVKSATAMGEKQAVLAWDPASDNVTGAGAIAYRIYLAKTVGGQDFTKPYATTPAGSKGAVVSGLDASTTYSFVVRAVDEAGNEDKNTAHAETKTTDTTPPTFSGVSKVTGVNGTSIKVDWPSASDTGSPADQIKYRVFLSEASGAEDFAKPTLETAPGATTATLTGLKELQTYYVIVRAVDAAGNVDTNVKEKSGATVDSTAPTFAGAKAATSSGATIKIEWDSASDNSDPPNYIAYDIYASKTAGGQDFTKPTFSTQTGGTQPITKYTFTGLDLNTTYYYVVRARDGAGNQEKNTKEVSAMTASKADVTAPVFGGLKAVNAINATTLELAWDSANDETTAALDIVYDVFEAVAPGGEAFTAPAYTTAPGETSYVVTGLTPKATRYYVVRARDAAGNDDTNVIEKSGTTLPDTTAPTFAGVETASAVGATAVKLTWSDAKDDADKPSQIEYLIYQSATPGGEDFGTPIGTTAPGDNAFVATGLTPATDYYFVVRARDTAGNVDGNTKEVKAAPDKDTTPPVFGGATTAVSQGPTSILISWSAASDDSTAAGEITYEVYVGGKSGLEDFSSPLVTGPGDTSLLVTGLSPNTPYYFVVRARDKYGNIETNVIEVTTSTDKDTVGPVFAGASGVSGATATTLTVNWLPASDNVTPPANIVYSICYTQTPGGCNAGAFMANGGTVTGVTSKQFTGLTVNKTYYFVVRAQDAAGNWDNAPGVVNSIQQSGTTTTDSTPPTFAGVATATQAGASKVNLTWAAATDNVNGAAQITYDIYWSTSATPPACVAKGAAGGQLASVTGVTNYQVTGLNPSTTYYFFVRARDTADNRECNTVAKSAATPADTTAPTGGTASAATPTTCQAVTVSWTQATDDVTPQGSIVYDVCRSTSPGVCNASLTNFNNNIVASVTGSLSTSIGGLVPNTAYYFVVRARDTASPTANRNANPTEVTATPLDNQPPPAPSGTLSQSLGTTTPRVAGTWGAVSDSCAFTGTAVTYELCHTGAGYACTSAATWKAMSTTSGTLLSGSATTGGTDPLVSSTVYTFYIRAKDASGNASAPVALVGARATCVSFSNALSGTYPTSVATMVGSSCNISGCHLSVPWDYTRLMPNKTSGCGPIFVTPNNLGASYFYQKVSTTTPACGGLMPAGAPSPVAGVTGPISKWITDGACQ